MDADLVDYSQPALVSPSSPVPDADIHKSIAVPQDVTGDKREMLFLQKLEEKEALMKATAEAKNAQDKKKRTG